MAVVCATIFYFNNNPVPAHVAHYAMIAGVATGWLAILFGCWESAFVPLRKTKIITTIFWHASLNGAVTILFTVWAVKTWNSYPLLPKDSTLLLIGKWVAILGLFGGNYFGGKLLLKYRVGMDSSIDKDQPQLFNHTDR